MENVVRVRIQELKKPAGGDQSGGQKQENASGGRHAKYPYWFFCFLAAAQRFRCAAAIRSRPAGLSCRLAFFLTAPEDAVPVLPAFSFFINIARRSCNLASSLSIDAMIAVLPM
jgi:hypothetical protein